MKFLQNNPTICLLLAVTLPQFIPHAKLLGSPWIALPVAIAGFVLFGYALWIVTNAVTRADVTSKTKPKEERIDDALQYCIGFAPSLYTTVEGFKKPDDPIDVVASIKQLIEEAMELTGETRVPMVLLSNATLKNGTTLLG